VAVTERLRDCAPLPHDLVHVDQAPKAEVAQWIGHGLRLHACVSAVCAQALPPQDGCTLVRLRDWTPPAHDLVQVEKPPKAGSTQSTGQQELLQLRASLACGHALPPNVGCVMARLRLCAPAPHDRVQVDHESKAPTTQSVAQANALQTRVSAECGHATPPCEGSTVARLRDAEPVPHDLVHVDQAPKVGTTQSTAHGAVLQSRVSAECGQTAPPNVGPPVTRLRCCEPVPHDFVQVDHESKVPTSQSTGQAAPLQLRVSSRYGHT
jgi:hypothetical protein